MKKSIVALAVTGLFAASAANAAVVYDKDGAKVDVGGSVRALLTKETDQRTDLKNQGSRLNFSATQDLGNGLSALGYLRLKVTDDNFSGIEVNKLYLGLKEDGVGTLTFGNQATNGDDVQLGDYSYVWGGNSNLTTSGKKVAKFRSAEFGGFSFGADYLFKKEDKGSKSKGFGLAAFYAGDFGGVQVNANLGYTYDNNDVEAGKNFKNDLALAKAANANTVYNASDVLSDLNKYSEKAKAFNFSTEVVFDPVSVAFSYGHSKYTPTKGDSTKVKGDFFLLGVKGQVTDAVSVYGQYTYDVFSAKVDGGKKPKAKSNLYLVGTDYQLAKNVVTFLEVAHRTYSVKDSTGAKFTPKSDNKVGVGLRVSF